MQDEWGPREWAVEGDRVLGNGREAVDGGPHDCASRVVWGQDGDCPRLDLRDHMKYVADGGDSEPTDGREKSRLGRRIGTADEPADKDGRNLMNVPESCADATGATDDQCSQ